MEVVANFNKNLEVVKNSSSPDISVDRLSKELNKEIDKDYTVRPTNDRFVVTQENKRGKVSFPMILITDVIGSVEFRNTLKNMLENVPKSGKSVTVSYVLDGSVIYLCNTYANNKTIRSLKDFCIQYKYVVAKGVVEDNPKFDDDVDFSLFKPLIIPPVDNLVDFKEEVEDKVEEKTVEDMKVLQEEINNIINSQNNFTDNNSIINNIVDTKETKPVPIENSIPPTPIPTAPMPVQPTEIGNTEVKGW